MSLRQLVNETAKTLAAIALGVSVTYCAAYTRVFIQDRIRTTGTILGSSMEPTIHPGDSYSSELVNSLEKVLEKGDVVICKFSDSFFKSHIKRIAAVPGETVHYDGEPLIIPAGKYWVVGDNKTLSKDSRHIGPVEVIKKVTKISCPHAYGK